MAMLCMARVSDKHNVDVSLLTAVGEKIVLHGLEGGERDGELFTANSPLCADGAANFNDGRDGMEIGAVGEVDHLSAGGMEARLGGEGVQDRSNVLSEAGRHVCHDDCDPAGGLSSLLTALTLRISRFPLTPALSFPSPLLSAAWGT
jgi:hypothetical protein